MTMVLLSSVYDFYIFLRVSVGLQNIAMFLNLELCFLTLLSFFPAFFSQFVLHSICGFKNADCLVFNTP